jgi:c-di-GMP-binding flagellar brake protein YcgR
MSTNIEAGIENLGPYQVHSRREIVTLLRNLNEHNQLVRMIFSDGAEAVVTSVLQVDEAENLVVVDSAPGRMQNERIAESPNVSFETMLERIRILFFTSDIQACEFDSRPAFCFPIPLSVIRLQRREYYRVLTPRFVIGIPVAGGAVGMPMTANVIVQNISAGGIGIVDDKKLLDQTIGRVYENCRIMLPGSAPIDATLEVRNSQEISVGGGKTIRRLGCLFVNMPKPTLAALQRYITKLEREQNAKATGMA